MIFFAQLGLWPLYLAGSTTTEYRSTALLEIAEPDDVVSFASVPDRYLLSQLEVLNSPTMAAEVQEAFGGDIEASTLQLVTEFEHLPETDVVKIETTLGNAEEARLVAQTYAERYIAQLVADEAAERDPQVADYEEQLAVASSRLAELNAELTTAMAPYVSRELTGVPDPTVVVPAVVVERDQKIAEVARLTRLRDELVDAGSKINSRILQSASLPTAPVPDASNTVGYAIALGSILLGVSTAILLARFSTKVLDETAAEGILGVSMAGATQQSRVLRLNPLNALERLPQGLIPQIDQICVRAEAMAKLDRPLVVAVVGTQRGAGATTLALAMAGRMAAAEYSVLVIDADRRDPWMSVSFGTTRHGGIPALSGLTDARLDRVFTHTGDPSVRVLGFGSDQIAFRRDLVPRILEGARQAADIVVVDGGPLLEAASTVEFCVEADAIVLAVPTDDQRADDLAAVARQLSDLADRVLPVRTGPASKPASPIDAVEDRGGDSLNPNGRIIPLVEERMARLRSNRSSDRATNESIRGRSSPMSSTTDDDDEVLERPQPRSRPQPRRSS